MSDRPDVDPPPWSREFDAAGGEYVYRWDDVDDHEAAEGRFGEALSRHRVVVTVGVLFVVVIAVGLFSVFWSDSPAADLTEPTADPPRREVVESDGVSSAVGLNAGVLHDPADTVFGALLAPLLPSGFEVAFVSDAPRPFAVAFNALGDRFEITINSHPPALASADEISDGEPITVPEGTLVSEPASDQRALDAHLVTDTAIVHARYVNVADPAALSSQGASASAIAKAVASDMPAELITGEGSAIGTAMAHEMLPLVESILTSASPAVVSLPINGVLTIKATGELPGADNTSAETASIRVEMLNGHLAPAFLAQHDDRPDSGITRQSSRLGSWLVIVTVESDDPAARETLQRSTFKAVSEILNT